MEYDYFNPVTNKKIRFSIYKSGLINLSILIIDNCRYFIGQDAIYENIFNWKVINDETGISLLDDPLEWTSILENIDQSILKLIITEIEDII